MWQKITPWLWVIVVAIAAKLLVDTVEGEEVIKESPVIIDTIFKHYENPTITEYYRCVKSREQCFEKCSFMDRNCQSKCPICPVLYDHDVLVQGINDTDYRPPVSTDSVNQTNVIRIVNEIRNIVNTRLGNITSNNRNLINVYQNRSSKIGGKFGLGYNERGPCCHLIEPKRCKRSSRGLNCAPRRQFTCGSHCISRVMRAKRVVSCNEMNPEDCTSVREYIPEHRRPGCKYISRYPFIECRDSAHNAPSCARCLKLPYMNVMRGHVPKDCLRCYGHSRINHHRQFYQPTYSYHQQPAFPYPMHRPIYEPYIRPAIYNYDYEDDWSSVEDDDSEHNTTNLSNVPNLTRGVNNSNENNNDYEMETYKETSLDGEHDDENGEEYYDENENN